MRFFLTYLFKLALFLLAFAVLYEIGYGLVVYYYSLQLTEEAPSLPGFLSQAQDTLNMAIFYVHSLDFGEFKFVQLVVWAYLYHFYYLIIIFVSIIFYYQYRLKTLAPPNLSKQPTVTPQAHQQQKKSQTEEEVQKLVNSPEYKALQAGTHPSRWREDDQQVGRELEQAGKVIFG